MLHIYPIEKLLCNMFEVNEGYSGEFIINNNIKLLVFSDIT